MMILCKLYELASILYWRRPTRLAGRIVIRLRDLLHDRHHMDYAEVDMIDDYAYNITRR